MFAALLFTACGEHGTSGTNAASPGASATDIQSTVNRLRMPAPEPNAPFLPLSGVVLDGLRAGLPELAKARDAALAAEGRTIQALVVDMRARSRNATKQGSALQQELGDRMVAQINRQVDDPKRREAVHPCRSACSGT